jgi:hypothetical protein
MIRLKMPPVLVRNTLLSPPFLERISGLPRDEETCDSLVDVVTSFQEMKAFASEAHTELHLVKPILKTLGFAFESKPKFFEEQIKNPDFALFRSEPDRLGASSRWGTKAYYENVLGLLMVKRYGRNLEEGIGGFFLDFENRIPLFQSLYVTKRSGVPWGILTNGKTWVLLRRPLAFEKSIVEVDLEDAVSRNDRETLGTFSRIFSSNGLTEALPALLEEERDGLIALLQNRKASLSHSLPPGSSPADVKRVTGAFYEQMFAAPDSPTSPSETVSTDATGSPGQKGAIPVKAFDQCDILNYLLNRGTEGDTPDLERVLLEAAGEYSTKEKLLSLKILDMTPGFGVVATRLTEAIAYLSLQLSYAERHSFVAEWENDRQLHKFILDHMLYGVEKNDFSLATLQRGLHFRFGCSAPNYRPGNPLLGMSMTEVQGLVDGKDQTGLFLRHPREVMAELRDMSRLYFSLCDRIKEDAAMKAELEISLRTYRRRMKDIMDLLTASFFSTAIENRRIKGLLNNLDADEAVWESARGAGWFHEAKEIAANHVFFHMEIEFPFLLNERFNLIVIQPALQYLWEKPVPVDEAAKAYIKRAMTFLAEEGRIVLIGRLGNEAIGALKKSKRYTVETKGGAITVGRRR